MMKPTTAIAFTTLLMSCSMTKDVVDPSSEIHLKGVSTLPPQNGHWHLFLTNDKQKALEKVSKQSGETLVARLSTYSLPNLSDDEIFLQHISKMRAQKPNSADFKIVRNDEYLSVFQGTLCVEYHSISKSEAPKKNASEITLNIHGFHCKHPENPHMGVNIEYSLRHHQNTHYPSFDSDAENFFGNLRFTQF